MSRARILIVEDETDVLDANRIYLENSGYEVACAINLCEARNIVWEKCPDLILLDVILPDGSGYDFCAEVRSLTSAPIIFLTCLNDSRQIVEGLSLGADDYITKPYNMDILGARIAARLRATESGHGVITAPPLRIDLRKGKVWMGKDEIVLSAKEIQLLAFFAQNIGRAYTPEEIYHQVWGEVLTSGSSNTVRVHISNLRGKLRLDDGSLFEINLTPDKGYIFQRTY